MKKNIKLTPTILIQYVAGSSLGLLLILTLAMLLPSTHHAASATCATGDNSELCVSSQAATELSVSLQTAISVALENQVNLDITPTSSGATGYSSAKLSVSTNSNEGYGIFLSTSTPDGDLLSTSSNNAAMISNTSLNNVPLTSLAKNSYGYALESTSASEATKYSHIPTTNTAIKTTNSTTATDADYAYGDIYYLSFGAKIGTDIPAGSYSGTITVSAIANPRTIANLSDLTYMQDMTANICDNTREGYTKQLVDSRDGKSYWVAKLKDGNCWMTQNLALDLSTDKALTPGDSDVSRDWTPKASTNEYGLNRYDYEEDENFTYASWNIGKTVTATPLAKYEEYCDAYENELGYTNNHFTINIANVCTNHGLVDVSDTSWQPIFISQAGSFNGEYYPLIAANKNSKTYDAHYLIGNYYNFDAATAGSLPTTLYSNNANAPDSICPKGWQLPNNALTGNHKPQDNNKSYYRLLLAYGYTSDDNWPASLSATETNPLSPPMYFTMSGYAGTMDNAISLTGDIMYLFSSTVASASTSAKSYHPSFLTTSAKDSTISMLTNGNGEGYTVRCVSR